eukprot:Lithocolla_globosa_v1_NODE_1593_length_2462_cov_9.120066.p2 type:complete len:129 gc:universal NODE_1593_length_2462_cov_9.120066:1168-1554(+)
MASTRNQGVSKSRTTQSLVRRVVILGNTLRAPKLIMWLNRSRTDHPSQLSTLPTVKIISLYKEPFSLNLNSFCLLLPSTLTVLVLSTLPLTTRNILSLSPRSTSRVIGMASSSWRYKATFLSRALRLA